MHYFFFQTVLQDQAHLTTGVIKRRKTADLHPHDSTVKHSGHSHSMWVGILEDSPPARLPPHAGQSHVISEGTPTHLRLQIVQI